MSETTSKERDRAKASEKSEDAPRAGDKANPANSQGEAGKRLDEGLEETFPSSDPVSVKITK